MTSGKEPRIGSIVAYFDEYKKAHNALVTAVWHNEYTETKHPGLNIVIINPDPNMDDPYGRQILRDTSIPHISANPADARCWDYHPGEDIGAQVLISLLEPKRDLKMGDLKV